MQITNGKIKRAQKICVYGPEGIGKSTFVSHFPQAIFSDVEGSTDELDVARLPKPTSWEMLKQQAQYLKNNPEICRTWIIDTADWAEKLCSQHVCAKAQKEGIEDIGYGKGYVYLEEEFGRLLNLCNELLDVGINVVFTAHAQMRKFEQPDETGSYDRWELKLSKKTTPLMKEWADTVFFVNYKTYVINVDGQGTQKGKNKVQGGKRVMYTTHHICWDAKNRYGLPDEVPFEYSSIAHCIPDLGRTIISNNKKETAPEIKVNPVINEVIEATVIPKEDEKPKEIIKSNLDGIPKALIDLIELNKVTLEEIQQVVGDKGYYPKNTPIQNYDPGFISGVLVAAWPQVFEMIVAVRELPFK